MASKKRVVGYLEDEDWKLWQKAIKKYKMKKSVLLKEILHSWLFEKKLQLEDKNG